MPKTTEDFASAYMGHEVEESQIQKARQLDDRLLKPREVADRYGVTETTLGRWRQAGEGPRFIKVGTTIRYPAAALLVFEGSDK